MKIVLCCSDGMSTSILVRKMQDASSKRGLENDISAMPVSTLEANAQDADVILLGPQVRYMLKDVKKEFPTKPVEVIAPQDYGMARGDKVLDFAFKLAGK
ncbi:PTS sugar transporter subunit IIB [Bifidobacterium sp. CP2]|uniref:PTS sugar transporter subunit IIB n=1 Tax=Bifidobacterium TaxID=1678 RepID=UPI001BDC969F|nr:MULTISPECIES: PTS sugar transporter subunit IIB [Bifidobacterium]MBT1180681.1 PTS sugar transporter subunit IIB [Bifidobacterium sp. CP2]MBW3080299.1 PTS sugar transporter subunit IIB [Bifidobacterium saguinibicoloris]